MTHIPNELQTLKTSIFEMWNLVISQMVKARFALEHFDKDLIIEIAANEKRVDAFELKINLSCENILALYSPVANDLRFVLSVLKTNYNLERVGDYAYNIATLVRDLEYPIDQECMAEMGIKDMFDTALRMLKNTLSAFEKEDSHLAREVFRKDELLDQIKMKSNRVASELIKRKPDEAINILSLLSVIRKLERVGDQTKNMAEELIFYLEAKVLRHGGKT
ncbi:MAG: phosphate transport system regulatory protein PhoU [Porphyromonadaceae bacterium]|nr:MAG: phosphate transport system regulatory protein PhoU [Porphyromonadaceae bacterium]